MTPSPRRATLEEVRVEIHVLQEIRTQLGPLSDHEQARLHVLFGLERSHLDGRDALSPA